MTNKQKQKIYLKAARFFERKKDIGWGCAGFCDFIESYFDKNIFDFPEYRLFKPKKYNLYWFLHTEEGKYERINALLLAAEMCND